MLDAVLWAQRSSVSDAAKNFVYLTISVPDVPKEGLQLDLKPTGLTFTGTSGTLKRKYHVELEFYAEIDPKESKINHTAKNVEMKLQKKELKEEYWPRLLKDAKKLHFLKTDFDKWIDEDEQNEAPKEDLSQFGGGGMGKSSLQSQTTEQPLLTRDNRWHAWHGRYVTTSMIPNTRLDSLALEPSFVCQGQACTD